MKCMCPKCHENIELDFPEVTEEGTSASCPACKANFTVHRECFGGRALRRTGEISCASCGDELGPQIQCTTCGAPFPDYIVTGHGGKRVRRTSTKLKLKSSPLQKPDKAISQLPTLEMAMKQGSPAAAKKQKAVRENGSKKVTIIVSVIVLLASIAGGAAFYIHKQAESAYLKNFSLATYAIQVGADKSRKVCLRIATEWKTKVDAGQAITPRPSVDEDKELTAIRGKVDSVKSKLTEEPEKFKGSKEMLGKIEAPYNKLQSLALSPGNSLTTFTDSINRLDGEYKQGASAFKAGIPEELLTELRLASQKYRGLRPLFK